MNKEEIEKEAEEKFKVNNEDKDREHYYDRMWFKTGYLAGAEPREKKIEELEQENAELRSGCGMCYSKDKDMLIKAKEIIRQLLNDYPVITKEVLDKLEQFIKEIKND